MWHSHYQYFKVIYFPSNQLTVKEKRHDCAYLHRLAIASALSNGLRIPLPGFINRYQKILCCRRTQVSQRHFLAISSFTAHLIQHALQLLPSSPCKTWWITQVSDFWLSGSHKDQRGDFCLRQVISVAPSLYLSLLNDFTS